MLLMHHLLCEITGPLVIIVRVLDSILAHIHLLLPHRLLLELLLLLTHVLIGRPQKSVILPSITITTTTIIITVVVVIYKLIRI